MHELYDITSLFKSEHFDFNESEILEFKEKFTDEAIEAIGAFANTNGGTILIGVSDNGAICGTAIGKRTLEDIANRIYNNSEPHIQPSISILKFEGKNVIKIAVAGNSYTPISIR